MKNKPDTEDRPLSAEVTMRFMMIVGEIIMQNKRSGGKYNSFKSISASVHCTASNFSQYKDNKRNVTIEMVCWLHINHGVNLNWIATGKGERYCKDQPDDNGVMQKLSDIEMKVSELEKSLSKKSGKNEV